MDSENAVKRSGFIAYNQQGIAVDEQPDQSGNPASVKRFGFVGSDDHEFTDEELEEQVINNTCTVTIQILDDQNQESSKIQTYFCPKCKL